MMSDRDEDSPFSLGQARSQDDTSLALRVELRDADMIKLTGEHTLTIPKSQIHDNSEVWETFQQGELVINEWLAEQRGWL